MRSTDRIFNGCNSLSNICRILHYSAPNDELDENISVTFSVLRCYDQTLNLRYIQNSRPSAGYVQSF